ncbi:MAG: response regulator [Treponema sp.]|jgi:signal transduction histidine kinase/HPt (histidine-containing phosphotransfer) domain-containing protein|nr:response regulator [Treponema sp.]
MDSNEKNRVLIVDDEKLNIEVLSNILENEYTALMAKNGSTAIEMANKYLPDIILLDVIMPDMNGFDVLAVLKASDKTHHIPVIIITGLNSVEDEGKGLSLGAADFIHKPFNASIVRSRVNNQMQLVNQIRELVKLHQDLKAAIEAAETANRTKSAFLAKMSHEIRTPLNAILGISEIQLQDENIPKEIKKAFTMIFNSGDLLLGIINDILDMSKIEAGKLELNSVRYDVASLINDTVFLNMIKYENKPIDFALSVDENVPSAMFGDELRIKQVLNNLLTNAFKYTKAGEVELSVAAEIPALGNSGEIPGENQSDDVTLVFLVRDTGQGMTSDQLDKLFDEYSRFNSEANRTTEGTGLGMSITQNLIRMMNGEILAKSEPGKGSLFTVRLRQGNVGAPALGKEVVEKLRHFRSNYEAKTRRARIVREPIPNGKVLVVDDMDMNLYVAKGMLSPYGLCIDTATSGFEAIDKIKRNEYDLVFMDHMMPKMDGMETTREIRKLGPEYETLPIIALTANAVAGMRELFLANGFNGFIPKPIVMQELDEILREWLSSEKVTRRAGAETADADSDAFGGFIDAVKKIEEINPEIGMGHFSDMKKDMYYSTLGMFCKKVILECDDMAAFLDAKDLESFAISVHAMKSSLATIGAMRLSETAFGLETASKNHDFGYCAQGFPAFHEKLLSLHEQLSAIFPATETSREKKPGDVGRLRENAQKAIAAAEDFDNDAGMEIIRDLLPYDFGEEDNGLLENAFAAFENFEYEGAVEIMKKLGRRCANG